MNQLFVSIVGALAAAGSVLVTIPQAAAQVEAYPAKGQTPQQQAQDTAACQQWAKQQTGFDPQQALSAATPAPTQPEALRARKRAREEQQELNAEQQQQKQMQSKLQAYNQAEKLCLQGRGYTVG